MFVGHDWGSMVVWTLALRHPERVAGVVGMSVPFIPAAPAPPIAAACASVFGDMFFYIALLPGARRRRRRPRRGTRPRRCAACSPARLASRGAGPTRGRSPTTGAGSSTACPSPTACRLADARPSSTTTSPSSPAPGSPAASTGTATSTATGSSPPHLAGATVEVPSLFIGGTPRPGAADEPARGDGRLASTDHRGTVLVEGAGHWVQQEAPDEVNAALIGFLDSVRGVGS